MRHYRQTQAKAKTMDNSFFILVAAMASVILMAAGLLQIS